MEEKAVVSGDKTNSKFHKIITFIAKANLRNKIKGTIEEVEITSAGGYRIHLDEDPIKHPEAILVKLNIVPGFRRCGAGAAVDQLAEDHLSENYKITQTRNSTANDDARSFFTRINYVSINGALYKQHRDLKTGLRRQSILLEDGTRTLSPGKRRKYIFR